MRGIFTPKARRHKDKKYEIILCVLCVSVVILVFAAYAEAGIVGYDDFGRKIVLPKVPERIVVVSATPIAVIFELGAGDKIVGVPDRIGISYSKMCQRYPSLLEKPRVGGFSSPNIEKIILLAPDLIIIHDSLETPGKYSRVFERYGLPYAAFCTAQNVAFGLEQIKRLGVLLNKKREAKRLTNKIKREITAITNKVSSTTKTKPLVFYWWGTGNGTYGRKAAIHELIELAGGINLSGEFDKQWFEISSEYVINKNPDVIVISYWNEDQKAARIKEIKERPGFEQTKAVKNNRVYTIDGNSIHSIIRFPEAIRNLAEFIHPEIRINAEATEKLWRTQRE